MKIEIERKFLIKDKSIIENLNGVHYIQGYLSFDPERTVRVRTCGEKGYIAVKGKKNKGSGLEYEYEIPYEDAAEMLEMLCKKPLIDKHRYNYEYHGKVWEIDVFHKENEGLVIAEIELVSIDEPFSKPDWIGTEVTGDSRYSNSNLVRNPYTLWNNRQSS